MSWEAVTLWFELSQAGCWDLSSQMPAVSKPGSEESGSPGTGLPKPWEEGLPASHLWW